MNEDYLIAYSIIARIAKAVGISPDHVRGFFGCRGTAGTRPIAITEISCNTGLTLKQIGKLFYSMHYTTVLHHKKYYYQKLFIKDKRFMKTLKICNEAIKPIVSK